VLSSRPSLLLVVFPRNRAVRAKEVVEERLLRVVDSRLQDLIQ
jgi:hypothetical protein